MCVDGDKLAIGQARNQHTLDQDHLHIGLESPGRARALDVPQRFPGGFIKCLNTVVAAAHRHYAPADSRGDVDFARRLSAPRPMALELGSAPCMERVFQYGSISMVVVSL